MADIDRMIAKTVEETTEVPIAEPSYALNICSNGNVLEVELPGVEKADIDIEVKDRTLIIVGKRYDEGRTTVPESSANVNEKRNDMETGNKQLRFQYHLRFRLRGVADGTKVECKSFKNGVLILTLPKLTDDLVRKIAVE